MEESTNNDTFERPEELEKKEKPKDKCPTVGNRKKSRLDSEDSGIVTNACENVAPEKTQYKTTPNMDFVRPKLDHKYSVSFAAWENTGLVPKYYRPYKLIGKSVNPERPVYECNFCQNHLKGHFSIISHARRHIGDYPFKCTEPDCDYFEVSSSGLKNHHIRTGHSGMKKIEGPKREEPPTESTMDVNKQEPDPSATENRKADKHNQLPREKESKIIQPGEHLKRKSPEPYYNGQNSFKPIDLPPSVPRAPAYQTVYVVEQATGMIPEYLKPFKILPVTESEVTYACDCCKYTFRNYEDVIAHTRQHYGDHPYRCTICGFASVSRKTAEIHMIGSGHEKSIYLKKYKNHQEFSNPAVTQSHHTKNKMRPLDHSQRTEQKDKIDCFTPQQQYDQCMPINSEFATGPAWMRNPIYSTSAANSCYYMANGFPYYAPITIPPISSQQTPQSFTLSTSPTNTKKVPISKETTNNMTPENKTMASDGLEIIWKGNVKRKTDQESEFNEVVQKKPCLNSFAPKMQKKEPKLTVSDNQQTDMPDYNFLIMVAEQVEKQNDHQNHNWLFCDMCKSAFYNTDLYKTHFNTSPNCNPSYEY
ncbi:Oidioi.mRNA.OKI2018_I69.PAR.g13225.t1.cds [Oikopleura dioica]|uniref:Oidioi.mRNA.OKI2018_I69.PAR.g13225.t1.cds n=1 Tax=Oikopleura dioica TaxID=34765 RepID=A0ABN7SAN1_OIKDI|nr:Oidioi.mRNA.OKI2018_I69.PAR.g13225.t1.cds [Oikopleura dioica]